MGRFARVDNVALKGVVTVVPEARLDNQAVKEDEQKARQRLIRNIGIRYRHICRDGMVFSDLAVHAFEKLIDGLNWKRESVDAILLVTQTPDYKIPATACILQERLGLPLNTGAFDINLGCSGYPYGIFVGASMIGEHSWRRVVCLIGDQSASDGSDDNGREVLFGDACSATALEFELGAPPIHFDANTDGSGKDAIIIPHGGTRHPFSAESLVPIVGDDGVIRSPTDVHLDGPAIFNFSVNRAPENIMHMLGHLNKSIDQVDFFLLHQANKMINETIRKKLDGNPASWPLSLEFFGNTSSASIPTSLNSWCSERAQKEKLSFIWCGFGIGLSWATMYIETDSIYAPPVFLVS